jgi:hypothetical protein
MFSLMGDLAGNMGSTLAELCQVMILAGSIFEYIRFEDAAHRGELVSAARMNKLAGEVDAENPFRGTLMLFARAQSVLVSGRTRNRRHIEGSELIKVRLPPSFVSKVDLYAKLTKASRSAILSRFFDKGLLLYMRSQRALMRAVVEAMHSKEHESHAHRAD